MPLSAGMKAVGYPGLITQGSYKPAHGGLGAGDRNGALVPAHVPGGQAALQGEDAWSPKGGTQTQPPVCVWEGTALTDELLWGFNPAACSSASGQQAESSESMPWSEAWDKLVPLCTLRVQARLSVFFLWGGALSCSPGWPYVIKDDLNLSAAPAMCWD